MTAPAIFSFENIQVRTLGTSEFPLFVANDIAKALGYQNLVRTVNDRVDPEDLFKSEMRASEILCPWDNRSPPNGCIQ